MISASCAFSLLLLCLRVLCCDGRPHQLHNFYLSGDSHHVMFFDSRTGLRRLARTVLLTSCSSRFCSAMQMSAFRSSRVWGYCVQLWCVVCAVVRCLGTVSDGSVGVRCFLMLCFYLLSGMVHGLHGVASVSWRFFSSRGAMLRLNPKIGMREYVFHFAQYMFATQCWIENVEPFTQFLHIVNMYWSVSPFYSAYAT